MEGLALKLSRNLQILQEFDYVIEKTEFDKKDLNKWKEKKYGKGAKAPKEYHKQSSVAIKCSLFMFDIIE